MTEGSFSAVTMEVWSFSASEEEEDDKSTSSCVEEIVEEDKICLNSNNNNNNNNDSLCKEVTQGEVPQWVMWQRHAGDADEWCAESLSLQERCSEPAGF